MNKLIPCSTKDQSLCNTGRMIKHTRNLSNNSNNSTSSRNLDRMRTLMNSTNSLHQSKEFPNELDTVPEN